jgi:hypothetical protein
MAVVAEHRFVPRVHEPERSEGLQSESRRRGRHAGGGGHQPNLRRAAAVGKKNRRTIDRILIEG